MEVTKHKTELGKVDTYETTIPLLRAMYIEFQDLSKKKPDAAVSKSKIKIANRLLSEARTVLIDEKTIGFLDLIDEDDVPQVSDVTLIMSQYVAAMGAFREKYYGFDGVRSTWFISK
jgi:hypothetical protein